MSTIFAFMVRHQFILIYIIKANVIFYMALSVVYTVTDEIIQYVTKFYLINIKHYFCIINYLLAH